MTGGLVKAARRTAFAACVIAVASPAAAHGFGQRFDLPLPLWLWVTGAGATIILSFVVVAIFLRQRPAGTGYPSYDLLGVPALRWLGHPAVLALIRVVSAAIFVLVVAAGLFGAQDSFRNIIVPMVWVVWWVGFAFVSALVGNIWAVANPIAAIFAAADGLFASLSGGRRLTLDLSYPAWLGRWPAVLLFLAFAWAELVWTSNDVPAFLARAIIAYSAITWAGMFLFGEEKWLQNGEAFAVAFGLFGRFAPLGSGGIAGTNRLELRPPGAGLLDDRGVSWSFVVFVLTMLSTVTFDGFLETPAFQNVLNFVYSTPVITRLVYDISDLGITDTVQVKTLALIAFPLVFILAFSLCSAVMAGLTRRYSRFSADGRPITTGLVARSFVLTLVPIAIAYHLAHYFSLLLTAGQFVIPLVSDPFGAGWDLFGTAKYQVNIGIVSPTFFWYAAVTAIVIGHVVAVCLAHIVALRLFGDRVAALVSQIPMVALMVGYTMVSLWILAQPIVGR